MRGRVRAGSRTGAGGGAPGVYHPRTQRHQARGRGKLRFRDATAMAVGGMIGGGIFSVLGVTIELAGHLAFLCFVLAGAVAGITAHSYAGLTRRAGRSGGPYAYLCEAGHPELAAVTSWFLIFGYVLALAVYAFTFGHYVADLLGWGRWGPASAALVLAAFFALNARGVGASTITEDAVVITKLVVLGVVAGAGMASWSSDRLTLASQGYAGVFVGAASIFVAYEGFELLSYDYDDIERPERTLPQSLYASVLLVVGIYVVVTLGSQMLVSDELIVRQREVAFAEVGQEALGGVGRWLATAAAVLATSSAINATLFSTARLVRDLAGAAELPASLGRMRGGVPFTALLGLSLAAGVFAMAPGIGGLLAFGSLTFLSVFALINHLHARTSDRRRERVAGRVGSLLCVAAVAVVVIRLLADDPAVVAVVGGCFSVLALLRLGFRRRGPNRRTASR